MEPNNQKLAKIVEKQIGKKANNGEIISYIDDLLEEIQAICVGADSPDAIKNGEENPKDELEKCRQDISAISNNVEKIQEKLWELSDGI